MGGNSTEGFTYSEWRKSQGYYTKKEINAFLDTLEPETREQIKEIRRKDAPRAFLAGAFSLLFVFAAIGGIIMAAIRGNSLDEPFSDILFLLGFFGFIFFIISFAAIIIIATEIQKRKCQKINTGVTAKGIVMKSRPRFSVTKTVSSSKTLASSGNVSLTQTRIIKQTERATYGSWVVVPGVNRYLTVIGTELYDMGDKVTVEYDNTKPRYGKVVVETAKARKTGKKKSSPHSYAAAGTGGEAGVCGSWATLEFFDGEDATLTFDFLARGEEGKNMKHDLKYVFDNENLTVKRYDEGGEWISVFKVSGNGLTYTGKGNGGMKDPFFAKFYPKFTKKSGGKKDEQGFLENKIDSL